MNVEAEVNINVGDLEITFTKNQKILKLIFIDTGKHKFSLNDINFNITDNELFKIVNHMLKNSTYKGRINNVRRKKCKNTTGSLGK